ncbi:hypothetical protein BHM03_00045717 [Ensete ventricosum]|uniref:Uncharacterized protein n=1 Tax=Ensete ventricosum TaxID=4639 RepID=A0A445MKW7_ENSVE|nr:hypothetical protein BHM03_00045717 [Ensete ventricosum]
MLDGRSLRRAQPGDAQLETEPRSLRLRLQPRRPGSHLPSSPGVLGVEGSPYHPGRVYRSVASRGISMPQIYVAEASPLCQTGIPWVSGLRSGSREALKARSGSHFRETSSTPLASSMGISCTSEAYPYSMCGADRGSGAGTGTEDVVPGRPLPPNSGIVAHPLMLTISVEPTMKPRVWRNLTRRYPPPIETLPDDGMEGEPQPRLQGIDRDTDPPGTRVVRSLPRPRSMKDILRILKRF